MTEKDNKPDPQKAFVDWVISRALDDNGFRAAMKRADNPNTEPQAWRYLVAFCNLDDDRDRLAFGLVGAAIARERPNTNGGQALGTALKYCKQNLQDNDDSEERKLRRLLACDSTLELVPVLRPILRFVQNSEKISLDYAQLLRDVLFFTEKTKIRWAQQYYSKTQEGDACTSPE